jgi:hypothetical protein
LRLAIGVLWESRLRLWLAVREAWLGLRMGMLARVLGRRTTYAGSAGRRLVDRLAWVVTLRITRVARRRLGRLELWLVNKLLLDKLLRLLVRHLHMCLCIASHTGCWRLRRH